MTQPVSSGARWPQNDVSCSEPLNDERETFTCDETDWIRCASERALPIAQPTEGPGDRDAVPRPGTFCRNADTVIEGFLCGEPTVVSNACRKPNNAFDEFVCDDAKMERLQWTILRETWSIVKTLALSILRGRP
jgi:hypothetical protein